jgi:hypothetical protein
MTRLGAGVLVAVGANVAVGARVDVGTAVLMGVGGIGVAVGAGKVGVAVGGAEAHAVARTRTNATNNLECFISILLSKNGLVVLSDAHHLEFDRHQDYFNNDSPTGSWQILLTHDLSILSNRDRLFSNRGYRNCAFDRFL